MVRKKKNKKIINLIYVLAIMIISSLITKYMHINKIDNKEEGAFIEINENLVFKTEGKEDKLDINRTEFKEISKVLDEKKAKKVILYKEFVGFIDNIDYIKGIGLEDKRKLKEKFTISSENGTYIKRNINDLSIEDMKMLGFNSKEIKYIIELKKEGKISSDLYLKDKVNSKILEKYIIF